MLRLDDSEREWVSKKWAVIRESQRKADAASARWREINDRITRMHEAYDKREIAAGRPPMTDLNKAEAKKASLPLNDAFDTHKWNAAEAQRHIADLSLFLQLRQLGVM